MVSLDLYKKGLNKIPDNLQDKLEILNLNKNQFFVMNIL